MSNKLQKLTQKWYKKLANEGFKDIESSEAHLEQWHSRYFQDRNTPEEYLENVRYYEMAEEFLQTYNFDTSSEKLVWEKHAQGMTIREIAKKHRKSTFYVHNIVFKLRKVMLGF